MITGEPTARPLHGGAYRPQIDQQPLSAARQAPAPAEHAIAFGPFHLLPAQRLLLEAGRPVRLGSRALEILIALVERPGELLGKAELMARVWPDIFVEQGNLKVQVAGLRRALRDGRGGNRYLATIPGQGYRFVAPVTRTDVPGVLAPRHLAEAAPALPLPITGMIDRIESVEMLTALLPKQRFVTIVGPGGIGKTTLAIAVARALSGAYEDGVQFVDLARPDAHGVQVPPGALPGAAASGSRMLLVLDNCEHVIEESAAWAVEMLNRAPGLHILATSREPLRAEGEHVHRLAPLGCPPSSVALTAAAALGFPAVQLFVERAAAAGTFRLRDEDAPLVAEICRRLDGIPLAIELAAGRIDAFGVRGLAARLSDPLQLLTGGRRPAPVRHQTLRALLDWSHALLCEPERAVLRRLAVFAGSFTLEAASAVAASPEVDTDEVVLHVANLVAKSLIAADVGGAAPCYRLLGTTRAYALEKLSESGECEQVARRHAEHVRHRSERAETGWGPWPMAGPRATYGRRIDDAGVRQGWARSPAGLSRSALTANR